MSESIESNPTGLGEGLDDLLTLLNVEPVGENVYRGVSPVLPGRRNVFGGQVMAQALRAAAATVDDDRPPHSLHAYFLREGRFNEDIYFEVDRSRDGRSFSSRLVNARQDGKVIFTLSASFHRDEFGRDFQSPIRVVTPPPAPDWVDPIRHRASGMGIDVIDCTAVEPESLPAFLVWTRARGKVIEDRVLDACIMAYMSDMGPGGVTATAVGLSLDGGMDSIAAMASIDHAMWFHRASQSHEWMLIDATPVSVAGSRGLIRGTMHDAEGRHLASFAQELLVRERR